MKLHWKAYARPLLGLMLGATLVAVVACGGDDDDDDVAPAPAAPAATAAPAAPAATAAPAAPAATAAPAAPGAPAATAAPAAPAATAAPGAPAATAAPAATVAATSAPAVTVKPEGEATVAINPVQPRSGTPRFCSAGCAEAVYQSSIFETLFRPNYQDFLGEFPEEGVIATGFTLDSANVPPQWLDFDIRAGVPFHEGWGDVTAEDVVFSFNDANANTQPESVHGQAGDFAPLIKRLEVKGPLQVRLIYNNYDSRGIRHRFSTFWQTASIVSEKVFEKFGPDGMRDQLIGTGPYTIQGDDWIPQDRMVSYAVEDHYRHTASVAKITALQVGESAQMAALLRTGGVIMSMPALKDWKALIKEGYELNTDTGHGIIRNIGMTGNYWEPTRFYDGKVLEREVADKAWVSASKLVDPEGYENARLVRQGLAHSIDRQGIVDSILDGFGMGPVYFGYQPPPTHPLYQAGVYDDKTWGGPGGEGGWEYAYDLDLAQDFLTKAGYPDGFPMENVWVGPPGLTHELMIVMGGLWSTELNIDITLNNSAYQTYRPGLVARSTSEPFLSCGDDSNTSMPYDWARGFVMSSWSDGGYGVGMEVPWAAANYAKVALMTDKAERLAANIEFTKKGIEEAICIGIVHDPINTMQDPDAIAEYEKLPTAEGNYGTLNNMESLVLK